MASKKADFIKVPTSGRGQQTMPVKPEKRLPNSEIRIEMCDESDCEKIAQGLYTCFPEKGFWDKKEPIERRPSESVRVARMAQRLKPSFTNPHMKWIKAVLASTGEIMGIAGWMSPENRAVHNIFRRDAIECYGWQEKMGWSDADITELWESISDEEFCEKVAQDDVAREQVLDQEPHWYLAPLFTWPEYQGRGVGSKLMNWAIEQADSTNPVTPLYLESAPNARPVYMHMGFVPQGKTNLLRRGPAVVRGLEAEEDERDGVEEGRIGKVEVQATA